MHLASQWFVLCIKYKLCPLDGTMPTVQFDTVISECIRKYALFCTLYHLYNNNAVNLFYWQNPQYDIKESTGSLHSGISQPNAYYPYDHSLGQYQYDR